MILSILNNLVDVKIIVSILLIFSSIISLNLSRVYKFKFFINKYRKLFISFIGIIHGFSNMGGGFLSIFSTIIHNNNKFYTRNYIAYGYLVMGSLQLITLMLMKEDIFKIKNLYYLIIPIIIFYPIQKFFKIIENNFFHKIIILAALIYGLITLLINL